MRTWGQGPRPEDDARVGYNLRGTPAHQPPLVQPVAVAGMSLDPRPRRLDPRLISNRLSANALLREPHLPIPQPAAIGTPNTPRTMQGVTRAGTGSGFDHTTILKLRCC